MGGISKCTKQVVKQAGKLYAIGATNAQVADILGVTPKTVDNWIANRPEFKATTEHKRTPDGKIEATLFRRALGMKDVVTKTVTDPDGGITETVTTSMVYDTTAMIFWLKNRDRERWNNPDRDDKDIKITIDASALGIANATTK